MTNDVNPFDDGWLDDADRGVKWPMDDHNQVSTLGAAMMQGPTVVEPLQPANDHEAQILECLKEVTDPELGVNVVDLGLVYGITVSQENDVTIDMTLTTPACPLTDQIEWGAQAALADVAKSVTVNWVWLPPWTLDRITEDGREQLRYIGYNV